MWPFDAKPKVATRSAIDGATVKALLDLALRGRKRDDYRHFAQKDTLSVVTMDDVAKANNKAYAPWKKDVWECEDIARSMVNEAQKMAANEGRSWAVGTLRARAPKGVDGLHVYVWAIILTEGRFAGRDVVFYDPTARQWTSAGLLYDADYTLS